MRRRRRDSVPPGEQVPENGCNNTGKNNNQRYGVAMNCFCNRIGNIVFFEYEKSDKIEKCSPYNSLKWSKNFGRNNGCDGIGGIMKTINKIENNGKNDDGQ